MRHASFDEQPRGSVVAFQTDGVDIVLLFDREGRVVVNTWKQSAANQGLQSRRGVTSRNVDAFLNSVATAPFDGDSVRSIFGGKPDERRNKPRSNLPKANQTDSADCPTVDQCRTKRRGQEALHYLRLYPVVDQNSPVNQTSNDGYSHQNLRNLSQL